jgi:hypothetical protein
MKPKSASTETKSALDKMNNVLVENGAMVGLI